MDETILSPKGILYCHYRIIERTGGQHGVRDVQLLKSALSRPLKTVNGRELFPTPFSKAAVLMHALLTTAPFNDGNSKTAFAAAMLTLNEYGYDCQVSPEDVRAVIAGVVQSRVSFGELSDWLEVNSRPTAKIPRVEHTAAKD